MIRVAVAAASPVTRAGLETLVGSSATLELAGSFAEIAAAEPLRPDVMLAAAAPGDLPPPLDGGAPAYVLLGAGSLTLEALRSGVRAILPESASAGEILAAVEAAGNGMAALDPHELESLLSATVPVAAAGGGEELTARELDVLRLMAEGAANKAIAWKLAISEHTVKFHVASILAKLGASSRTEAVTKGLRRGMIFV